jgi:hypothetical protein
LKSNVSNHLEVLHCIYIDACNKCPAEVSDLRDLLTIRSRVEKEGLSFLTITLPTFAKDFERSLDIGFIDSTCFRMFRKYGAIPVFLRGMLSQVFDQETGRIKDEAYSSIYVEAVRQICLAFKKVELPCTPERENKAIENFIFVEQVNKDFKLLPELYDLFRNVSDCLWTNMLGDLRLDMLAPRHGPGATAERISGNQKYALRNWYDRLEPFFSLLGTGYSISAYNSKEFEKVTFVPVHREQPVRVTLVPKTLKTPRIIAIEPVCMQYAQQALQHEFYSRVESYWLTAGHVNFTDQSINQRLALSSSKDGRYVTIDLSDASDRVLHDVALTMFDGVPDIRDAVDSCRSRYAELPDGRIIGPLAKFASMGSALCFPVEAMYFYTICVASLLKKRNLPVNPRNIFFVSRGVYIYGDDIIVPTDDAGTVLDYLQKYNCKVNSSKTFLNGKFRESCGVDAYDGYEVTPTYLRRLRPENRQQASELISWVATANLFYSKGYWRTASLMYSTCERLVGSLPYVSSESSALGRVSFLGYRSLDRWDDSTHAFLLKAWVPQPVYRSDSIDGYAALMKSLLSLERRNPDESHLTLSSPAYHYQRGLVPHSVDGKHLERTARRGAVTLKRRWVPAT